MKMTILLLAALSTLVSCGKTIKHKKVNIHPSAAKYVATFEEKANITIDDLEVTYKAFASDMNGVIGYCMMAKKVVNKTILSKGIIEQHVYETPLVVLNSNHWDSQSFTKADKEELIYHELGHCIYSLGHDSKIINGVPASIMYPYHLGRMYEMNYGYYLNEFFGEKGSSVAAFSGMQFNSGTYASKMNTEDYSSRYPAFEEIEVADISPEEIKDCVNHKEDEHIHINETEEQE